MSKLFKILITLLLICLSCTTVFACGGIDKDEESTPESEIVSVPESQESESKEEVVVDSESNFEIELPEVDRR